MKQLRKFKNGYRRGTAVDQLDLDTGEIIAQFPSQRSASTATGTPQCRISSCCNGASLTANGYCWRFSDEQKRSFTVMTEEQMKEATDKFRVGLHTLFEGTGSVAYIQAAWRHQVLTDAEAQKKFRAAVVTLLQGIDSLVHPDALRIVSENSARPPEVTLPKTGRKVLNAFKKVDNDMLKTILQLCAAGSSNREIAAETGCSPGMVCRIRHRSKWVSERWPAIDAWLKAHPKAKLHTLGAGK